ncbi:ECF transporter S component [Guggenheimella bovis]
MKDTRKIVLSGLFIAIIFVLTAFVKVPSPKGYIHAGDAFVLLSGVVLGPVLGPIVSGVGSALADLQAGYGIYAPVTFAIKAIMALIVSIGFTRTKVIMTVKFILAEILMIAGYFTFEAIIYGGIAQATPSIPLNLIQGAFGVLLGVVLMFALKNQIQWNKDSNEEK